MKREFPALYEAASVWIATPLLGFSMFFYAHRAITQAASDVYPVGIAALGVTAALSGICFTMVPVCDNPSTARYAGEKFLHSSLLLMQSLLILYVRDAAVEFDWIRTHPSLTTNIRGVAGAVLSLITAAAAWTWYHGFSELNGVLWKNWERRIRDLNEAARASKEQPGDKLPSRASEPTVGAGGAQAENTSGKDGGGSTPSR